MGLACGCTRKVSTRDWPSSTAQISSRRRYLSFIWRAKELSRELEVLPRSATEVLQQLPDPPELHAVEETLKDLARLGAIDGASDEAALTPIGRVCLSLPLDLHTCRLVWLGCLWGCAADAVVLACCMGSVQDDPFEVPSPFVESMDTAQLARQLGRSLQSRSHFDMGAFSEPLMLRALFLEWWRGRPGAQLAGFRSWANHARSFSRTRAVVARRLTQLVCAVADCAGRSLRMCEPGSSAGVQLRALLRSLGAENGRERTAPGDWVAEWEAGLEEDAAAAAGVRFARDGAHMFEAGPEKLRALLAAAFSDSLIVGRLGKKCDQGLQVIRRQRMDPQRVVVMSSVPPVIQGKPGAVQRVLAIASDGAELQCEETKKGGSSVMAALPAARAQHLAEGDSRGTPGAAQSGEPILNHVALTVQQLLQFPCGRKEFSITLAREELERDEVPAAAQVGASAEADAVGWPWLSALAAPEPLASCGQLLALLEALGDLAHTEPAAPVAARQLSKKGRSALGKLAEAWPQEACEERGVSADGLSEAFFAWLTGLFAVEGAKKSRTVKKAPSFQRAICRARAALREREDRERATADVAAADGQDGAVEVEFGRDWVSHPCRIEWKALWRSSEDDARIAVKVLPSWRNPTGFACHVLEEDSDESSADFRVLGCCGGIQLIGAGNIAFTEGFVTLRLAHLPFWLLTASVADADLQFGFESQEEEAPQICAARAFGEELPCKLSAEAFVDLAAARGRLRQLARAGPPGGDGSGEEAGSEPYPLRDCRVVSGAVERLLQSVAGGFGAPGRWCAPQPGGEVKWLRAGGEGAGDGAGLDPLREFGELQEAAALALGGSGSELARLRNEVVRAIHRVDDPRALQRLLAMAIEGGEEDKKDKQEKEKMEKQEHNEKKDKKEKKEKKEHNEKKEKKEKKDKDDKEKKDSVDDPRALQRLLAMAIEGGEEDKKDKQEKEKMEKQEHNGKKEKKDKKEKKEHNEKKEKKEKKDKDDKEKKDSVDAK
ncbi:unnamed protein product [Prorocentrum cordatum]|uniref:Helicase-associated domain-containing protein n=1 Tax=Prorocentrum cordatum TaxID=2364126 RepID=A0ABN9PJV7_9DINO|nr:unnamed protein product [Polarella glacialis]